MGDSLQPGSILKIIAYGAWNGVTPVDNSVFQDKGMFFKGNVPVNDETIQKRIGVRTRFVASEDERIGVTALKDLMETSDIDLSRIKIVIGATNVGEDKHDPGPLIRHPFELIHHCSPKAVAFDLYAGCPGFNVAVELVFMLSLAGVLKKGDLSVIVGAENIHRAKTFKPLDTANILFGDDALATALETKGNATCSGRYSVSDKVIIPLGENFVAEIAGALFELIGREILDGIIMDNQRGKIQYRIPATAARVQRSLVEMMYPEEASKGVLDRFRDAIAFYDQNVKSFAYDIMSDGGDASLVESIARAYVESGKHGTIASIYLSPHMTAEIVLHRGEGYIFEKPEHGIIDTHTRTHGCFADYIQALEENGYLYAEIDGKGVFLHATRGARLHLNELLAGNGLTLYDMDLLIEHQANFAMIPLTLERALPDGRETIKQAVTEYISNRMVTNIHERGNCSVVCMQRLPYDLQRGVLKEDTVQGYPVNRNLDNLRNARIVLYDSVGSGMTRSSVLMINE